MMPPIAPAERTIAAERNKKLVKFAATFLNTECRR
jgi:hypothetical protein